MTAREKFETIEDPRHPSYVEHKLSDILTIIMCGMLCGLDTLSGLVIYADGRSAFLKEHFGIAKIPSKATLSRVLSIVNGAKIASVIIDVMRENIVDFGQVIAVDGKAIRATAEKGKPHSALQILTAYFTESGVTFGQKTIHEKTNEIPVFQEMLEYLDVSEKTITADAMHCQKETCKKIVAKKGNYVFGLKENHKNFYDDIRHYFESGMNCDNIETFESPIENARGRVERRICSKIIDISCLGNLKEWKGLKTVFAVRRIVSDKHKTTDETNYYITSLSETPEKLLAITREHWKIENLHWMLDVVFSEDDCQIQESFQANIVEKAS
ncbi:ISAs1 family transposase [Alphaproteobacteria bacterium]|nr:ISAs1 family transposase [Alphaproteobacteria bacterium]